MYHLRDEKSPNQHSTNSVLAQDLSQQDSSSAMHLATQHGDVSRQVCDTTIKHYTHLQWAVNLTFMPPKDKKIFLIEVHPVSL